MKDNKKDKSLIRSSSAEYLTFIATTGDGGVDTIYADENIWLTQKMMGTLYNIETNTVNYHLKKIFLDSELDENSVIRDFRITAKDGKTYKTKHYNLYAVIAKAHAETEFEKYRIIQDQLFESDFDKMVKNKISSNTPKKYNSEDEFN